MKTVSYVLANFWALMFMVLLVSFKGAPNALVPEEGLHFSSMVKFWPTEAIIPQAYAVGLEVICITLGGLNLWMALMKAPPEPPKAEPDPVPFSRTGR